MVALIVLGPLVEEMIFRGWLTGTGRALCGTAVFLVMFYGVAYLMKGSLSEELGLSVQLLVSALAFLVFLLIERGETSAPPHFYRIVFPFLFWIQGIVFGSLHFGNIQGSSSILPFLMTAPLIIVGWIFAYARIVTGIGGAWLLHALYNLPLAVGAILVPISLPS